MIQPLTRDVVILAAGKGTRMKSLDKPKVMFAVNGKPLVHYVVEQALAIQPSTIAVVVGYLREQVESYLSENFGAIVQTALQDQQLGTGHAVAQAELCIGNAPNSNVLILSGDVPLLRPQTLLNLLEHHEQTGAACTVLSVIAENPFGYGRIVRNHSGDFERIVEQKDANPTEQEITEINSGIYVVARDRLFSSLQKVQNANAQGEYYLTDIIAILKQHGEKVQAVSLCPFAEVQGVNTIEQLQEVEQQLLSSPV